MPDTTTTALIAGASAVAGASLTGGLGYLGVVKQVKGENERLRKQQEETQRQQRRETYEEWLALLERRRAMILGNVTIDTEVLNAFNTELSESSAAVKLYGSDGVRQAMEDFLKVVDRVGKEADRLKEDTGDPWPIRARAAWARHRSELESAESSLSAAMREDI